MTTLAAGVDAFALTWWVCAGLLGMDTGAALGMAALPGSGRQSRRRLPRGRPAGRRDHAARTDSLAVAYQAAGQQDEAIPLIEQTLTTARRLGADHPLTLCAASNLAGMYAAVDRLAEAIPLYERTLG
jgi:hypothetical protein